MMTTRRAAVDGDMKSKLHQRIREILDEKSGEPSEGEVYLYDEPVSKTARIAMRLAMDFPTQDALEAYLKKYPDADRSKHKVVKEQEGQGKKEDGPKQPREKAEDEPSEKRDKKEEEKGAPGKRKEDEKVSPDKKKEDEKVSPDKKKQDEKVSPDKKKEEEKGAPGKKEDQGSKREVFLGPDNPHHPAKAPEGEGRREAIKDALISEFGEDAVNWRTHKLDKKQLTRNVNIRFPDGTSKRYKDCSDEEKKRVEDAMDSGLAASKGMNDYSSVNVSSMKRNMANNLSHYEDKDIEETKSDSEEAKKPMTKENMSKATRNIQRNAETVLHKYAKAFSPESLKHAKQYVSDMSDALREAVNDGSLSGVSEADMDEFIREDVKRVVHQEVETHGRSLGDHGARHVGGNVHSTMKIMSELNNGGIPITGKQKLMGVAVQSNHDMGYTVGAAGYDVRHSGEHVSQSKQLATEEKSRYDKIFGEEDAQKIIDTIGTHDSFDTDWEKDPMTSAVRLADNTALFGNDKVQDLFIRSPKTMGIACKMRAAAEAIPEEPKKPKQEKFKDPAEYEKAKTTYDADKKDYDDTMATPEMKEQIKEARSVMDSAKKQMHDAIDEQALDEFDSDQLHHQVDEMSEGDFSTSADVLSRYSGKLKGFKFDKEAKVMDVDMAYSPEGQTVDMVFGDKVSAKQFDKWAKDGNAKPVKGKFGKTVFSNKAGKAVVRMNIDGIDKDPVQSATSEPMKDFLKNTARHEFRRAADMYGQLAAGKKISQRDMKSMQKTMDGIKGKSTPEEWKSLEKVFGEMTKEPTLTEDVEAKAKTVKKLKTWPLLESEKKYMRGKTASVLARIASMLAMELLADRVAVDFAAARGMQVNRKDKDTMSDTGGSSKTRDREPDKKPRREDVRKPFRTKTRTDEEKDSDLNRGKDRTDDKDVKTAGVSDFVMKAKMELARWPRKFIEAVKRMSS